MNELLTSTIYGGLIRFVQGAASATPTLLVGLLIAAVLRYYLRTKGTQQLFGGQSLRALPQSWAVGMLLPVCSIGVIPILIEMRRAKVKPGALSAFALSAPLFNPLSLLYGLTLSRPLVILMFAFGSLLVVTIVGLIWDRAARNEAHPVGAEPEADSEIIGLSRLVAVATHMMRQLAGPVGFWSVIALSGLIVLATVLPWGSMQSAVEQDDLWAPATMTAVSIPVYATPMLAMSQLGMMFQHANSPGAAFVLLVLGTGMNFGILAWLAVNYGFKPVSIWFVSVVLTVMGIAYAINQPLIPPGVEPAGHTHAFDIYTTPIPPSVPADFGLVSELISKSVALPEMIGFGILACLLLAGIGLRVFGIAEKKGTVAGNQEVANSELGFDRIVSPQVVGATMLCGLIALSIVMCYGYYPGPEETLEEIRVARAETLTAAGSGQIEHALHWLGIWDDWSRRLEVGTYIRKFEVRPYQRMQGYLIRKKLELLEHELEHDPFEPEETKLVIEQIFAVNKRWTDSFRE